MPIQRITRPTLLMLSTMLGQHQHRWYGLELCRATGLASGTVYPIIARLEREGWIASKWEDPTLQETQGRPRRRYYWVTGTGFAAATELLSRRARPDAAPLEGLP